MEKKPENFESIIRERLIGKTLRSIDEDESMAGLITNARLLTSIIVGIEIWIQGKGKRLIPFDQYCDLTYE